MTDNNIFKQNKPEQNDPLQEVLREGARRMLAVAMEAEASTFSQVLTATLAPDYIQPIVYEK